MADVVAGNRTTRGAIGLCRRTTRGLTKPRRGAPLPPPITGLALYHAQQAAEKALKVYLVFRGRAFPLTHNLAELARPLEELDTTLLSVVQPNLDLSNFATLYRYPGSRMYRQWLRLALGLRPPEPSGRPWKSAFNPGRRSRPPG